jgi:predicted HTH domain antitoxin
MIDPKYFSAITEYDEERTMREQWEEGYIEGMLEVLTDLVNDGIITLAQAAEKAHMTVAEFEAKTGLKE